jgi:ATP-dependent Clp protease ATP-binding subunit ClpE
MLEEEDVQSITITVNDNEIQVANAQTSASAKE